MTVAPPPADAAGGASPLRVVVVDDSAVQRRFARAAIEADGEIAVVGEARDGRDALDLVTRLCPDAVLMDLHLPVMNGIEAIEGIMATRPTPILVYSAFVNGDDRDNASAALAAGAVDVIEKPTVEDASRLEDYGDGLRRRIRVAARVRVITHPRGRLGGSAPTMSTRRLDRAPVAAVTSAVSPMEVAALGPRHVRVIAVGASTGGPQALSVVLSELPPTLEAAVVVVQHMADGFIEGLAGWLDSLCSLSVTVAASGRRLEPGTISIAPSGYNLVVHRHLRVTLQEPPPSQHHVPGVDVTLTSVAESVGADAVGVLLTGMGRDGAAGLRRMRDAGAFTLAQDMESSAVYGMPAAAVAADAVDVQLPLARIGSALRRLTGELAVEPWS